MYVMIDRFASNLVHTAPVFSAEPMQIALLSNPDEFFEKLLELIKKVSIFCKFVYTYHESMIISTNFSLFLASTIYYNKYQVAVSSYRFVLQT